MMLATQAAADGLGVVLAAPLMAREDIAAGRLVVPFSLSLPTGASYYLVYTQSRANDPSLRAFRNWIIDEAQRDPWADPDRIEPSRLPTGEDHSG
jgi:LysR family glycine cleavage system transcriptional activator